MFFVNDVGDCTCRHLWWSISERGCSPGVVLEQVSVFFFFLMGVWELQKACPDFVS